MTNVPNLSATRRIRNATAVVARAIGPAVRLSLTVQQRQSKFGLAFVFLGILPLSADAQDDAQRTPRQTDPASSDDAPFITIQYPDADGQMHPARTLDLHLPHIDGDRDARFPTVVWFHGGGLKSGSRKLPAAAKRHLVDGGIAVATADYRLYPRAEVADILADAAAAVAWVIRHIVDHGGDPDAVFVSGHSAGGYLTSMVGLDERYLHRHAIDANQLAGLIPLSGHTITHFTMRKSMGLSDTDIIVDDMAPLRHIRGDAPPIRIITGDRDLEMLGRYEENAYFWRMLNVVKHPDATLDELQGFDHGSMAAAAMPLIADFVRRINASTPTNSTIAPNPTKR